MQLKASVMDLQPSTQGGNKGGGSQVESLKSRGTKILMKIIPFLSLPDSTSFLKVNQDLREL